MPLQSPRHCLAAAALAVAAPALAEPLSIPTAAAVLADGRCESQEYAHASRQPLSPTVELLAQQHDGLVALCLRYTPAQAYGVDLYIADGRGRLHNLHASAMLAQRERGENGWPDWSWWNNRGWSANPVRPRDFKTLSFEPSEATEFVLRREAFAQPWRLRIDIHTRTPLLVWPAGSSADDSRDWVEIAL